MKARLQQERMERDDGLKTVHQALAVERIKREGQLERVQEACATDIENIRRWAVARDGGIRLLIEREREGRKGQRVADQIQRDEAQKAALMVHAKQTAEALDTHRQEQKASLDKETSALRLYAKDGQDRLDSFHMSLKSTMDEELKARDEHITRLNQLLEGERMAREALINKCTVEHRDLLKDEIDTIRKDVVNSVNIAEAKREGGHNQINAAIADAVKRLAILEACLADKSDAKTLLNLQHELGELEITLKEAVEAEARLREAGVAALRWLIDEEGQARMDSDASLKKDVQKEVLDRTKAIADSTAKFKASLIARMQLV
jgi:myosin heavy subunit